MIDGEDEAAICEACDREFAHDEMHSCEHCEAYVCPSCTNDDGDDVIQDTCALCGPLGAWAMEDKQLQREQEGCRDD